MNWCKVAFWLIVAWMIFTAPRTIQWWLDAL